MTDACYKKWWAMPSFTTDGHSTNKWAFAVPGETISRPTEVAALSNLFDMAEVAREIRYANLSYFKHY